MGTKYWLKVRSKESGQWANFPLESLGFMYLDGECVCRKEQGYKTGQRGAGSRVEGKTESRRNKEGWC